MDSLLNDIHGEVENIPAKVATYIGLSYLSGVSYLMTQGYTQQKAENRACQLIQKVARIRHNVNVSPIQIQRMADKALITLT